MNARDVEIFCTIIRCRTLSAAAEQLCVTQPALSKALRHCEDRLGYKLFHRAGGRLNPTAEALALLPAAEELQRKLQNFSAFSHEIGGRNGGILRIGATSSVAHSIVPRAIAQLRRDLPAVFVVLHMLAMPELEVALASGRVDIGVALSPIMAATREATEIGSVPCVVLMKGDNPLASRPSVGLRDLGGLSEVGFGPAQDFGRAIAQAFAAQGLERPLQVECNTTTLAMALVRAGGDFAIVDAFARDYLPADLVAPLLDPPLLRPVMLVQSPGTGTPDLAARFATVLKGFVTDTVQNL